MKNNNPNSNWARGPVVRGPTVRLEKVANWDQEMYHPKNQKIIKKQKTSSKMQTGVFPNDIYAAQHTKYTSKNTKYIILSTK